MKKINTVLQGKMNYQLFLVFSIVLLSFAAVSNVSAATHTLTLTSSGSQSINVSASSGTAISSDSINVATTCRYGYNFTLSTSVSNNNLYLNGNISNNASGTYFSPADGTTALNTATNTWGYYYNSNTSTTPTSTSIFSPVPTLSSPATIKTPLTTPASSNINDNFKIYYGVNSAPSMSIGTYKMIPDTNNSNNDGTLVYTATIADACTQYTVHYNPTGTNMGTSVTGTGTVADQTMYEGVATNLTNSYFTGPTISGTTYYFTGWNTAQDGSGTTYTRGQSVTDLTTVGNTITLYAQWTDCPGDNICFDANVANPSDVQGSMGNKSIAGGWGTTTTTYLWAPNYKRDGYGFAAWNTKADGTGINYGPIGTISFPTGQYSTGGLKLYAKWVASAGNMQNWTGCSSMNIGDVTALKDTRDNDVYAVAKLADGKCWMIENLRLDDSPTLSSTNTHNPSLPLTNSWYFANSQTTLTTSNHLSTPTSPYQTEWCDQRSSDCLDQSMLATNNSTDFTSNTTGSQTGFVYAYGHYYNWYSATAGHGNSSVTTLNTSVNGDICPAGWHLPTGGSIANKANSDFWILSRAVIGFDPAKQDNFDFYYVNDGGSEGIEASAKMRAYPNNYMFSGMASGSIVANRDREGYYWTSTSRESNVSFAFEIYSQRVYPGSYYSPNLHRENGYTVRCIVGT